MINQDLLVDLEMISNFRKESSKTLFAYVFFMKGTPVIYQGEEIGMTNLHFNELK
uniref:CAZy families GH13 protein n=1 Tax=uncultured Bacillus sp. TaxID=83428 RepID=A0A060CQ60_9BACI|nr:CAZy families GH13 protein [uncultured Bacillus sp.]